MIPSSAIQVIERTPDRLVVLDPPYYLVALLVLLISLGTALQFVRVMAGQVTRVSRMGLLLTVPFLLAGLGLLTSRTRVTFSRQAGIVTVERKRCGILLPRKEILLSDVRRAQVQIGARRTQCLILVFRSGSTMELTNFGTQGGRTEAANAINAFLSSPPLAH